MQPALDANPWGAIEGPRDVFLGAQLHEFNPPGHQALVATRLVQCQHGRLLDVVGLVSSGRVFHAAELDVALRDLAVEQGAQLMAMTTQHPHLSRVCIRSGWPITGAVHLRVVNPQ